MCLSSATATSPEHTCSGVVVGALDGGAGVDVVTNIHTSDKPCAHCHAASPSVIGAGELGVLWVARKHACGHVCDGRPGNDTTDQGNVVEFGPEIGIVNGPKMVVPH